jgi:hypothetical protein
MQNHHYHKPPASARLRCFFIVALLVAGAPGAGAAQAPAREDPVAGTASAVALPEIPPVAVEMEMALGAAPAHLREGAGVYVLRDTGYEHVRESRNGFTCVVNRDHPRALKPTCWDAEGTRTIVPVVLLFGERLMQGVPLDSIDAEIDRGFRSGRFLPPARAGVAYMLSHDIRNVDRTTGEERGFPPHVMFYAPHLTNADIGAADHVAEGLPFIDYAGPHGYMIVMPRREGRQP